MSVQLDGTTIERIWVVDDDPAPRQMLAHSLLIASLEPFEELGPLSDLDSFISGKVQSVDAVICDHKLGLRSYATFDGAEAVARLYDFKKPAVLLTKYSKSDIDSMRKYRRKIVALMSSDDFEIDSVLNGFERCIREFKGEFLPSRKPWRTLLRVDSVDSSPGFKMFFVVIPAWQSSETVRLPMDLIASTYQSRIQPGYRFHAQVNIGAETSEELYFENFEYS